MTEEEGLDLHTVLVRAQPLTRSLTISIYLAEHRTCLLRNLYAGQEATVRTRHGTTGSKFGKEYDKAVYCHRAYLTHTHAEYMM